MLEIAKYRYDESDKELYLLLKKRVSSYFDMHGISKYGNTALLFKILTLILCSMIMYAVMITATQWIFYFVAFVLFLTSNLILGMTAGHDAAHGCLTGKKKWDKLLFQLIFAINGINPDPWKEKHNKSHHSFPNVHEYDSDMELSQLIYLSKAQRKNFIHRFQHLYAPFLYMFFTLGWIYYFDFIYHFKKNQGNLTMKGQLSDLPAILLIKIIQLIICLGIPLIYGNLGFWAIILAFFAAHGIVSLFLSFTFFMSHHVMETHYADTTYPNLIESSWLRHQIDTTVDFHGDSRLANFIFGGFNTHTAHHLFPGICHIHYPALTKIIQEVLDANDLNYRSIKFHHGVISHLRLLKRQGVS